MKLPTVGQCCCCVDLILGGKILGWLGIVSGCLSFISSIQHPKLLVQAFASIIVSAYWLYGIEKKRPSYLLLNVILSSIGFVLLVVFDVLFLIAAIYYAIASKSDEDGQYGGVPLFYWVLILLPFTLLVGYFWTITYSVYRAVKELAEQPPTTYQGVAPGVSQDAAKNPA